MKKKALLCGLNYPGTSYPLQGCVNDVNLMADVLTQHFGFEAANRRMLTNEAATTAAILERLEWLVSNNEPGDVLYFHYSGHGSQMVNQTYEADYEPDGKDEIICPHDLNWRDKVIRDDDLKRIFDKVPNGVAFTVVLDCCNSGSGLDQENQYQPFGLGEARVLERADDERWLPMPDDIANRARGLGLESKPRSVQSRDVNNTGMLITGCQAQQTSADAWIGDRFYGAATYYLADSLSKNGWDATHKTIITDMNNSMVKYGYSQRPQLDGAESLFATKFSEPTYVGTGLEVPTTALVEVVEPVVEPVVVPEVTPPPAPVEVEEPKKKTKMYVMIAIAVAALAFVAYSLT